MWTGDAGHYRELIDDDECLMVLPAPPFVMGGPEAIEAVASTPSWSKVSFSQKQFARPQEGLIVVAQKAEARDRIEAWRIDYNTERPHSALGHVTPNAFAHQAQYARKVAS